VRWAGHVAEMGEEERKNACNISVKVRRKKTIRKTKT
jgi:hypothetical protein